MVKMNNAGFDNPSYIPDTPSYKPPTDSIHPSDHVYFTKSTNNIIISADEGASIKPTVRKEVKSVQSKISRQVVYSILRNSLCYLFAFCLLVLLINAKSFPTWDTLSEVILLMLMCLGLVGVPAQCLHVYRELRNTRRTLIPQMLTRWKQQDDFERMCQQWQTAAPLISIQIILKTGAISCDDPNHWTRTSRKTDKKLDYRVWTDHSENVQLIPWASNQANWIVLSKDYRTVNKETENSVQEDIALFSRDSLYDNYKYFMHRDFLLDVTEGNALPDVMPFLVFTGQRSRFYDFKVYKIMLFMCMDSVYNLLFHVLTRSMGEYCIVKYIER